MRDNMNLCIVVAIAFSIASLSLDVASFSAPDAVTGGAIQTSNQDYSPQRGPLYTPNMDSDMRMRLYLLSVLQKLAYPSTMSDRIKAKRTCLLNAGLSHSCDYKDALAAIDEGMFLSSDQTPGRK